MLGSKRWRACEARAAAYGRGHVALMSRWALPTVRRARLCRRAFEGEGAVGGASMHVGSQESPLPDCDWSRYHLQVLFIDRSDTLRARVASGLFEKISEWNGFGRALYSFTCGVEAQTDPFAGLSARAALMRQAPALGIPPKVLGRAAELFEPGDLDRYDVVVALDASVKSAVLAQVEPRWHTYYADKVRLLSEYAAHAADARLMRRGGTALLPRRMSAALQPLLPQLRAAGRLAGVPRPSLLDGGEQAAAAWNECIIACIFGAAGLAAYLIDQLPEDLSTPWLEP